VRRFRLTGLTYPHKRSRAIRPTAHKARGRASFTDTLIRELRARLPERFEALPELEDWLRTELDQLYDKHLSKKPFSYARDLAQVRFPVLQVSQQEAEELGTAMTEAFQAFGDDVASTAAQHYDKIIDGLAIELLSLKLAEYINSRS